MEDINTHIHTHSELYFTSPSSWSAFGMEKIFDLPASRNRIISHGSDVSVFNPIPEITCDTMRESMGISKDTILLGMFGAMTTNKGIHILLSALHDIVIVKGKTNYKLLLKGSNELYDSQTKLETIFKEFKFPVKLLDHIIFTGSTLSFGTLNELYNIVDIYVSPYLAEGFNLSPLEALTTGRRVVVPITGSTEQYMNDIYNNGGTNFITYVNSSVVSDTTTGNSYNQIEDTDLIAAILSIDIRPKLDPTRMIEYISKNYSWSKTADLLYEYFLYILEDNKKRYLN
jgi:glycosyltransferase involved in cell wall biosynthesis